MVLFHHPAYQTQKVFLAVVYQLCHEEGRYDLRRVAEGSELKQSNGNGRTSVGCLLYCVFQVKSRMITRVCMALQTYFLTINATWVFLAMTYNLPGPRVHKAQIHFTIDSWHRLDHSERNLPAKSRIIISNRPKTICELDRCFRSIFYVEKFGGIFLVVPENMVCCFFGEQFLEFLLADLLGNPRNIKPHSRSNIKNPLHRLPNILNSSPIQLLIFPLNKAILEPILRQFFPLPLTLISQIMDTQSSKLSILFDPDEAGMVVQLCAGCRGLLGRQFWVADVGGFAGCGQGGFEVDDFYFCGLFAFGVLVNAEQLCISEIHRIDHKTAPNPNIPNILTLNLNSPNRIPIQLTHPNPITTSPILPPTDKHNNLI